MEGLSHRVTALGLAGGRSHIIKIPGGEKTWERGKRIAGELRLGGHGNGSNHGGELHLGKSAMQNMCLFNLRLIESHSGALRWNQICDLI